jgi:predicted metal-dependent peptidase
MSFDLNDHIFRLLNDEPFFASLSRRIDKKESTAIPTAGVRVNPDSGFFEMLYNPEFFEKLNDKERSGVIIHEFYHLIFEHVTGRLPDELAGAMVDPTPEQAELFKIWNIAADLSINCLIGRDRLPEMCCFPGHGPFEDMPSNQTVEWNYARLREKVKESRKSKEGKGKSSKGEPGEDGQGGGFDLDQAAQGQFDSHGEWGAPDGAEDGVVYEIAKERLRDALSKSAQEASSQGRGWGSVSATTRKEIMERLTPKVDWKKVLRYFVKCSQRSNKRSTPKRINRRYAYIHPGRKTTRQAQIAISIDQSGSVSDMMLAAFYSELNKLADIATFTVIPFDTDVATDKVYEWKKGEKRKFDRVMYGGTCFNAPTEYVNENGFDGHIVLTDMCAPKPKPSKCPRMWMTDQLNAARPYFRTNERIVAIE